jgi:zinc and cadmium transporter
VLEAGLAVLLVQGFAAAAVLLLHGSERNLRRVLPYAVSVAVGVLLATGAAHLLPEAVSALGNRGRLWLVLVVTILVLFCIERVLQSLSGVVAEPVRELEAHNAHDSGSACAMEPHHHGMAAKPAALLTGAFTHSLVDGASVTTAFAIDRRLGWITALAIGLHEIPHRLGDFALLVHLQVAQGRAAMLAILAGGSSLLGWGLVVALGAGGGQRVAWLLPVSAGSFLYIALVDLMPELQGERRPAAVALQIACLLAGVALALGLTRLPGA